MNYLQFPCLNTSRSSWTTNPFLFNLLFSGGTMLYSSHPSSDYSYLYSRPLLYLQQRRSIPRVFYILFFLNERFCVTARIRLNTNWTLEFDPFLLRVSVVLPLHKSCTLSEQTTHHRCSLCLFSGMLACARNPQWFWKVGALTALWHNFYKPKRTHTCTQTYTEEMRSRALISHDEDRELPLPLYPLHVPHG